MNTQTISTLAEYRKKLSGYVNLLYYRYCNLIVKAEPMSLLSATIVTDLGLRQIEDVAEVLTGKDEFSLLLYPHEKDLVFPLTVAIMHEHPEYKIEYFTVVDNAPAQFPQDADKRLYIRLTAPEVDDERRDILKESAEALRKEAETNVETNTSFYTTRLVTIAKDEDEEEVDRLKSEIEKIRNVDNDTIQRLYEDKIREIDAAYERYLNKQSEIQGNEPVGNSMLLQ